MSRNPWRKYRGPSLPWWVFAAAIIVALLIQQILRTHGEG